MPDLLGNFEPFRPLIRKFGVRALVGEPFGRIAGHRIEGF